MNRNILGLALLVVGVVLLVMGFDAKDSFSSEVSEVLEDAPSDKAIWLLSLGGLLGVGGLAMLLGKRKS